MKIVYYCNLIGLFTLFAIIFSTSYSSLDISSLSSTISFTSSEEDLQLFLDTNTETKKEHNKPNEINSMSGNNMSTMLSSGIFGIYFFY